MIISQTLGLEQSENHKPAYFGETMPSPLSFSASVPGIGHSTITGGSQPVYQPTDGYYIPNRVQSDLANMSMYPTHPESSAMNSPGNYIPNAASVAANPGHIASHYATTGLQHTPCYPTLGDDYEMRPSVGAVWHGSYGQPPQSCYGYDSSFGPQYPYDRYCVDINDGVRRKNATRESTNTLKAWLQEHKKNPYPTKGEKIMLAIITKMTLTQVSTWFANARRRLKKENKMTWTPKNRSSDPNNNSKKIEVDEDDVSQHSQDNECKSDNEHSIDSDDSDARKVTSTNSNDDIAITSDFKEDFQSERCSVTSDSGQHHQETNNFSSQPPEPHLSTDLGTCDSKSKQWPSLSENTDHKAQNLLHHKTVSTNSPFSTSSYVGSSDVIEQVSSIVSSSLDKTEKSCSPRDIKYPSQEWSAAVYYPTGGTPEDRRLQREGANEDMESLNVRTAEIKSMKNNYSLNPISEPGSICPIVSSSFSHVFPSQHPGFTHTIDYYRQVDRPNGQTDLSYYPQNNVNSVNNRIDIKNEQILGSYPVNGEPHILSKTVDISSLPTSSLPSANSTSLNQGHLYQYHLASQDFSNLKLIKTVAPSASSYPSVHYQQENFSHIHANTVPNNLEYYQRKSFFNSDSMSYHSPADSQRK